MTVKWERLRLKDFAYLFSLQAGVVFFCCFGLVLSVLAFLKLCFYPLEEADPHVAIGSYFIATVFILVSLLVYTLGLAGSALENPRCLKTSGALLICLAIYWIILTGLSFSGSCNIIRYVCVDNRCTERFYVQNGYWRKPLVLCGNHSHPHDNSSRDLGGEDSDGPIGFEPYEESTFSTEPDVVINIEIGEEPVVEPELENDLKPEVTPEQGRYVEPGPGVTPEQGNHSEPGLTPEQGKYVEPGVTPEQRKNKRDAASLFGLTTNRGVDDPKEKGKLNKNAESIFDADSSDITNLKSFDGSGRGAFNGKLHISKNRLNEKKGDDTSNRGVHNAGRSKEEPETDEDMFLNRKLGESEDKGEDGNRIVQTNEENKPRAFNPESDENVPILRGPVTPSPVVQPFAESSERPTEHTRVTETSGETPSDDANQFRPSCRTRSTTDNHNSSDDTGPTTDGTTNHDYTTDHSNSRAPLQNTTTADPSEREFDPLWTPIGKTGSTGHFVLSIIYALLIFPFWYLYPIWLIFSLAAQIDHDEVV